MQLTETGESRINGYLFVLERSLKSFLPPEVTRDAVREIESHLRDRVAAADGAPNEREVIETILAQLGPPLRVAQAYSAERTIDEAVTTGRFVAVIRAVGHLAITTVSGFFAALGLLIGYFLALGFVVCAVLKPIFPDNVGIVFKQGIPIGLGAEFPVPPGAVMQGGYWIVPVGLFLGLAIFVLTQRAARGFLARWPKSHRPAL